jgi:hypothetical protein
MTRLERGFYDGNGEFVTADERVECRLGGRGTVNAIFQGGEAEVMFDDDADLSLVKWDHIWKLPSWALYKRAWDEQVAPRYRSGEPAPGMSRERFLRLLDAAQYLAEHIHEAPAWIVPCLGGGTPTRTSGSSIYPAVQNMLLAARALGLGATLTTLYLQFEKEAEAALGLPPGVHSYALLPIGYPMGRFGPVRRIALADVVYQDRWGEPYRDL